MRFAVTLFCAIFLFSVARISIADEIDPDAVDKTENPDSADDKNGPEAEAFPGETVVFVNEAERRGPENSPEKKNAEASGIELAQGYPDSDPLNRSLSIIVIGLLCLVLVSLGKKPVDGH
ncbi:MAG: hypothetical protein NUW37_03390 [Planctomycetes bacterium]|nr:hypothetical protein [Planctomycetota bacterium]